jgi:hypothetical protein
MSPPFEETVEVTGNDERRLCGLAGDDDNEDMREDMELFDRRSNDPINIVTSRSYPEKVPKVRRSGMALSASIARSSTLLNLVVALVTSSVIGTNALRGVRKLACLSLRSLLIRMVVCIIGSTVLCVLILNFDDCLVG